MDDTISRQAALDALEKEKPTPFANKDGSVDPFGVGRQNQWYRDGIAIMNLPSAQQWISCKTALPDDDTEVIVSCTDDSGDGEFSYVTTGWHYKGLWVVNNDRCYFVKAWQPLPAKPWEGEQDESDD